MGSISSCVKLSFSSRVENIRKILSKKSSFSQHSNSYGSLNIRTLRLHPNNLKLLWVLEIGYSWNLPSFAMWTNPSIVMSIKDRILVHVVNVWPLAASLTLIQFTAVITPKYIIDSEIFIGWFFGMWVMRGTGDPEGLEKALRFECLYHLLVYSQYFETNKTSVVNHCHF